MFQHLYKSMHEMIESFVFGRLHKHKKQKMPLLCRIVQTNTRREQ